MVGGPGQANEPCSRCKKHNLSCKIDINFKRVKKRGLVALFEVLKTTLTQLNDRKYEELQREIEHLRSKLADREVQNNPRSHHQYGIQNRGSLAKPGPILPSSQRLEDIELSGERVENLFHE